MKFGKKIVGGLLLILLVLSAGLGCTRTYRKAPSTAGGPPVSKTPATATKAKGHGPPPHAPAHGYRAKTSDGISIVFDTKLKVYIVVDLSNHYYYDGLYYRLKGDGWEVSARLHGSWEIVAEKKVPLALRSSKKGKGKGKGHGKGKEKGKGKD